MLQLSLYPDKIEAGCDEAGRGCLAGPVFAAAVILPPGFTCEELNDSKQIKEKTRYKLREIIQKEAVAWAVASVTAEEIDKINILNASFLAMQKAVQALKVVPEHLLIDGNRFRTNDNIPYTCIVKGDGKLMPIAAASILAKTYRDDFMKSIHTEYPIYSWDVNKGYGTATHRKALLKHGMSPYHRKSFHLKEHQLSFDF
ncbi:MAG: ribonuclease HII [Dysgonamonadaceae bacterium]